MDYSRFFSVTLDGLRSGYTLKEDDSYNILIHNRSESPCLAKIYHHGKLRSQYSVDEFTTLKSGSHVKLESGVVKVRFFEDETLLYEQHLHI